MPLPRRHHQINHSRTMRVRVLDDDNTTRTKQPPRHREHRRHQVQPVRPGKYRLDGIVRRPQDLPTNQRHIRRVRHHHRSPADHVGKQRNVIRIADPRHRRPRRKPAHPAPVPPRWRATRPEHRRCVPPRSPGRWELPGQSRVRGPPNRRKGRRPQADRVHATPASTASTNNSVSGRGMKTPGPTASSRWRNAAVPSRYCRGSRAARRSTSIQNALISASVGAARISRPRGTPNAEAISSSASTRGDAIPAAPRCAAAAASRSRTPPARVHTARPVHASNVPRTASMSAWVSASMTSSSAPSRTWSRL